MRTHLALVSCVVLAASAAGCVEQDKAADSNVNGSLAFPAGLHPWPKADGSEWPVNLQGPFELAGVTNAKIASFDGTLLDTWVIRPAVPDGTRVPVVLWSSSYFGSGNPAGNDPEGWDNSGISDAVPVNLLVANGYAVAIMNVRGSGNSGGCYQNFGNVEWKDQAVAVEWLGTQEWSNGRVGMMGLSYHGTTPWMAAVEGAPHLKTIVTAGMISTLFTFFHTAQGAQISLGAPVGTLYNALDTAPPLGAFKEDIVADFPSAAATRLCPELVPVLVEGYKTDHTDLRDATYWDDRDMLPHFGNIEASVFLTQGLRDYHGSGHAVQEDYAWANLPSDVPRRLLVGQWEHMMPNFSDRYNDSGRNWTAEFLPWLEFWLKGIGDPAQLKLGVAEYQDSTDAWHASSSWPPAEAEPRAIHLGQGALTASATTGMASFTPRPLVEYYDALCDPVVPGLPIGLLYETEPFAEPTLLAGNPFVLLEIEADQPGGQLAAFLVAIEENGVTCGSSGEAPAGIRFLGMGAADLRFHAGGYTGTNFPIGTPTDVRIDINNMAEVLAVGERLGLLLAYGDSTMDGPTEFYPTITLHEGRSHVVVPLVSGQLDSSPAWPSYPKRPFDPLGGDP